ncbi:MAG TPA: hypothetical protein VGW39_07835 [Chthoniobacterales bacterium]|nr:hypothetical protein [Chthoniobacterales bacterium]
MIPANVDIVPTDYRLSWSDIRHIERLPLAAGIKKPLKSIQARNANEAWVTCGAPFLRNSEMTTFTGRRKNGRWFVDMSSIHNYQPIMVE